MCQETTKKKEEDGALTLRGRAAYENLQIGTLGGHVPTMTIAFHPRGVEPACPPLASNPKGLSTRPDDLTQVLVGLEQPGLECLLIHFFTILKKHAQ